MLCAVCMQFRAVLLSACTRGCCCVQCVGQMLLCVVCMQIRAGILFHLHGMYVRCIYIGDARLCALCCENACVLLVPAKSMLLCWCCLAIRKEAAAAVAELK